MRTNLSPYLGEPLGRRKLASGARRAQISALIIAIAIAVFALRQFSVDAKNGRPSLPAAPRNQLTPVRLFTRLALQPQADQLRRRLGQRFLAAGRESSVLTGTLTSGGQNYSVRILRNQDAAGEQLALAFGNGPASLMWNAKDGVALAGGTANNAQRMMLERLALDSPDQFVLAQLRGANYFNMAQYVAPPEAANDENYHGPLWDVVRVGEREDGAPNKPQSLWRLYYLNCYTGLLEKVVYEENGETITAEISGWQEVGGEKAPAHFTWSRNQQIFMELSLNSIAHGPRQ